jgi:hypothetical protein
MVPHVFRDYAVSCQASLFFCPVAISLVRDLDRKSFHRQALPWQRRIGNEQRATVEPSETRAPAG